MDDTHLVDTKHLASIKMLTDLTYLTIDEKIWNKAHVIGFGRVPQGYMGPISRLYVIPLQFHILSIGGSRISEGVRVPTPKVRLKSYYLAIFSEKLHENERN